MASPRTMPKRTDAHEFAATYKNTLHQALDTIDLGNVCQAIEILAGTRANGRTIFVCGNGGSAATASHFVSDLVKGASFQRSSRFRIIALTDSLPTITSYSNDLDFEHIFSEPPKTL